jgi:light-regulated signal transduction histidine kinase (bacteriophytochrome)
MNPSVFNLAEIAQTCYRELTSPEMRDRISLKVADLPMVHGDYPMLVQVMTNLLSNAVKYSSHCEHPEITVGCKRAGAEYVFSVKDNGIGFDMKYADKLFGVFQRLHSAREYDGTGVGLAIVQRVIHRHGGRIWAEAEPDKGATFSFTLA